LYVHAEDILKSLTSHSQELTFRDLEIEKENAVESGKGEELALSVMVWEST
jgi:dihydroneopterin aldolase